MAADGSYFARFQPEAIRYQRPGDIIFSAGHGAMSAMIRFAQARRDHAIAKFSHVAICAWPGLLIHSVPRGGAQLVNIEDRHGIDLFQPEPQRFAAVRMPGLALDIEDVLRVITYWTGQRYNFRLASLAPAPAGQVFCSQLVVQILDRAGVKLPDLRPGDPITPSELYRRATDQGGVDVSDSHAEYARLLASSSRERWRLTTDPIRMAIRRATEHTLALSNAEAKLIKISAVLSAQTVGSVLESARTFGKLSIPSKPEFEAECRDLEFVLGQAAALVTEPAPRPLASEARNWMVENRRTAEQVRRMSAAIFVAHVERLRARVAAVAEESRGMERIARLLAGLEDLGDERVLRLIDAMELLIGRHVGFEDLPLAIQLANFPAPDHLLAPGGEEWEVYAAVLALRQTWDEAAGHERAVRLALGEVRRRWPPADGDEQDLEARLSRYGASILDSIPSDDPSFSLQAVGR